MKTLSKQSWLLHVLLLSSSSLAQDSTSFSVQATAPIQFTGEELRNTSTLQPAIPLQFVIAEESEANKQAKNSEAAKDSEAEKSTPPKTSEPEKNSKTAAVGKSPPQKSVRDINLDVRPSPGKLPESMADMKGDLTNILVRSRDTQYAWTAPVIAYRPLLFEDVGLERYGHHHGILQTPASAINFFGRIPVAPYLRGAHPCNECTYNLGYARPGDCVSAGLDLPGWSPRGALYQSATVAGWVFLIP